MGVVLALTNQENIARIPDDEEVCLAYHRFGHRAAQLAMPKRNLVTWFHFSHKTSS